MRSICVARARACAALSSMPGVVGHVSGVQVYTACSWDWRQGGSMIEGAYPDGAPTEAPAEDRCKCAFIKLRQVGSLNGGTYPTKFPLQH